MPKTIGEKAIFPAAITGAIHIPSMSSYLPITSNQIIDEILAAHQAGGAIAHVHVRDEETDSPNPEQETFRKIAESVKKHCDIIIYTIIYTPTAGRLSETLAKRVKAVSTLKLELASLSAGHLNSALHQVIGNYPEWKYA